MASLGPTTVSPAFEAALADVEKWVSGALAADDAVDRGKTHCCATALRFCTPRLIGALRASRQLLTRYATELNQESADEILVRLMMGSH